MRWVLKKDTPLYIIAEAGSSHDGQLGQALMLVAHAAWAKCSAVKFQVFKADQIAARRHAGAYIKNYRQYEIPAEWLPKIRESCINHKIDLVLSVYSVEDLDVALPYADAIKIASFETQYTALLAAVSKLEKQVIISTGMSSHDELCDLAEWRFYGSNPRALLHCISCYPSRTQDQRLKTIDIYSLDGFSDHSANVRMGGLAVACGAKMLEVHMKLFTTMLDNPDYGHSLTPPELREYVLYAQEAALAVQAPSQRELVPCEVPMAVYRVRI